MRRRASLPGRTRLWLGGGSRSRSRPGVHVQEVISAGSANTEMMPDRRPMDTGAEPRRGPPRGQATSSIAWANWAW